MYTFTLKNFTGDSDFPLFIQYGTHEYSLPVHTHKDYFELTIVTQGTAQHIVNDESYFIKKGDVFGVVGETAHGFDQCSDFHICNIMFDPAAFFPLFPDLKHIAGFHSLFTVGPATQGYRSRLRLSLSDFEEAERLIARIIDEYHSCRPGFVSVCTSCFIQLVTYLSRLYDEKQDDNDSIASFSKAVAHIERSFAEKLTMDEIASIAGLSVRHFQRQFKSTYHITAQEYIASLRMQKATGLLTKTTASITEIAMECGYQDSNLFSRTFRQRIGCSPREYRSRSNTPQY